MTLRQRILIYYSATFLLSLLIVGCMGYYEFNEQREYLLSHPNVKLSAEGVEEDSPLEETLEIVLIGGLPAILMGVVGGMALMKRALRPIEDLTVALEQTDIGNLSSAVPATGNGDELDRMTAVFNHMKARLGASFTQAREFTLHASHELKTPLSILHSTLEQILGDPALPARHRDRLTSSLEEVQRLSAVVGQLAFLAKADADLLQIAREPVDMRHLVNDLTEDIAVLAASAGITVDLISCTEATVLGDRMRLRQLLLNLADNAVKHNRQGGSITLDLSHHGDDVCFVITNTGPILPKELWPRVFERFFRGHASQDSSKGGSGLGLSIAASIVKAHHGDLKFEVLEDDRTQLTLTLPSQEIATGSTQRSGPFGAGASV